MADVIFNSAKKNLLNGSFTDLGTATLKVALVTSSYTPDQDNHTMFSDVTNEVAGTLGYTSGGATLTGGTVTQDNTNNKGIFDATDVTWGTSTITARAAVLYKSTGTAASSPLICYFDFGSDQSSSSGNFTITWGTAGILNQA